MMFVRTPTQMETPGAEDMDLGTAMCPPHSFEASWALPPGEDIRADTVPALFCASCGDVRLFRIPSDE